MIWFYTGVPGSGKSYHTAKEIYTYIQKGKNVIGNMEIYTDNIPQLGKTLKGSYLYIKNSELLNNSIRIRKTDRYGKERLYEPDDLFSYIQGLKGYAYNFHERNKSGKFKLHQTLIVFDECQELFNSRSWNRNDRLSWCAFFRMHRKLGYDCILISQDDGCIDKQIRKVLDTQVLHRNVGDYKLLGKILSLFFGGELFICITSKYGYSKKAAKIGSKFLPCNKKYSCVYDTTQLY